MPKQIEECSECGVKFNWINRSPISNLCVNCVKQGSRVLTNAEVTKPTNQD